ncbi:hypothetical protein NE575_19840, partial [Clostridium sp. SL.3.18]|nr:hypothetical protein [Clostridium sp. SL.3.18]
ELAINQYLCDTAEYDMDALDNAEKNNFETVDEQFNDSLTPYGEDRKACRSNEDLPYLDQYAIFPGRHRRPV